MKTWMDYVPEFPTLEEGSHAEGSSRLCAMELVAYMERLPHSDRPPCTCPVLAMFVRNLNDNMPAERRNELLPMLPMLVGTANPDLEIPRARFIREAAVVEVADVPARRLYDYSKPLAIASLGTYLVCIHQAWDTGLDLLRRAIELDLAIEPKQWEPERIEQAVKHMAEEA